MTLAPSVKRFRSLILSVALFLVVVISLMVVNYFVNANTKRDTSIIDGAGEMSDQFYNLALYVQQLPNADPQSLPELTTDIKDTEEEITTLLALLDTGGRYDYGDGSYIDIQPIQSQVSREALSNLQTIWQEYQTTIDQGLENPSSYAALSEYAFTHKDPIYDAIDEIYVDRFDNVQYWSAINRTVLLLGSLFVLGFVIWFGVFFLRRLAKSEAQLQLAREQTEEILSTINEGLFLVDENLIIAQQHSTQAPALLFQEQIAGKSLLEVLAPLITKPELMVTESFLNQLYSSWVIEELIEDLNPLKNIAVTPPHANNPFATRYLNFDFTRVIENDEILRVLVIVTDTTEAVLLSRELEQEKAQNDRQIGLIHSVLTVPTSLIDDFIRDSDLRLTAINDVLKSEGASQEALQEKINRIFREVHSIKGEASALKLSVIVDLAHEYEEELSKLKSMSSITGNDFLSQVVLLDEMVDTFALIKALKQRLGTALDTNSQPKTSTAKSNAGNGNTPTQVTHTVSPVTDLPPPQNSTSDTSVIKANTNSEMSTTNNAMLDLTSSNTADNGLENSGSEDSGSEQNSVSYSPAQLDDATSDDTNDSHKLDVQLSNLTARISQLAAQQHKQIQCHFTHNLSDIIAQKFKAYDNNDYESHNHESTAHKTIGSQDYSAILSVLELLTRHALSNQIEPTSVRKSLGKADLGMVNTVIEFGANEVRIQQHVDGRGFDFGLLSQLGMEAGLLSPAEQPTKKDLLALLFNPILRHKLDQGEREGAQKILQNQLHSLAELKSLIQRHKGTIAINGEPQQFSRITIMLPL